MDRHDVTILYNLVRSENIEKNGTRTRETQRAAGHNFLPSCWSETEIERNIAKLFEIKLKTKNNSVLSYIVLYSVLYIPTCRGLYEV